MLVVINHAREFKLIYFNENNVQNERYYAGYKTVSKCTVNLNIPVFCHTQPERMTIANHEGYVTQKKLRIFNIVNFFV